MNDALTITVYTSDAPTEWRPQPNRAQRREIERRMKRERKKAAKKAQVTP
jgi:hypothetical protein